MRTFFLSLLFLSITLFAITRLYEKCTAGFNPHQLHPAYLEGGKCEEPLLQILHQPFTYLSKGTQSYVFLSQDGQYILKLFKHKHLKHHPENREKLQNSCTLTFEKLKEESGLLYLHLGKTYDIPHFTPLKNRIGYSYFVDLNQFQFLIQKRAIPSDRYFRSLLEKGDAAKIENTILSIANLVSRRVQKKIADGDRAFMQNIAFSEIGEPLFIDSGKFYEDANIQEEEVHKRLTLLKAWSSEKMPALTPYVERVLLTMSR